MGLLVIVLANTEYPDHFVDDFIAVLIVLLTLLCGAYLSQCLYYRCCHTWSTTNKPYYPFSSCHYSSICGSYREEIEEDAYPEEEAVETRNTDNVDPDTIIPEGRKCCKEKLCYYIGCSNESVEEAIELGHINNVRQKRSKSLPNMLATSNNSHQSGFGTI